MKTLTEILKSLEGLSEIELFVIDLFCGAGGLSEGVEMARLDGKQCAKVVCCVNHDKNAILSHNANIPDALHFIEDIRTLELSPIKVIVDRLRELYPDSKIMLHASLECTNFSKAKGGQPRDTDSPMTRKIKEFMAMYGIVDIKMRMLRIPELKRIMGFPEDYVLVGTQADQKKFIGNAVEVTQARRNTEALCRKLRELRLKKLKNVA